MRTLIATATAGAGHLQAAAALEEAWRRLRPDDTVERVDVLELAPKIYRKAYSGGYLKLVARAPELYALAFRKSDDAKLMHKLTRFRRSMAPLWAQRFMRLLKTFSPDAVVCAHFLPLEVMGRLRAKRRDGPRPLTACVVTDFEAHALWLEPSVDVYCVAAEETKARLVARGVATANVAVTGIPISERFASRAASSVVRRRLGLREDVPVALVLGGGFGMGPVGEVLAELDKVRKPLQIAVVCGRNDKLRRRVAVEDRKHPTRVLGFVNNMQEWMAAADLILTKPGGLTSSEALAMGKPLVILDPIPGHEAANADFLLEHGVAVKVNRVEDLSFRIQTLVNGDKLATLSRAAAALGKPKAAQAICKEVVRRCETRS